MLYTGYRFCTPVRHAPYTPPTTGSLHVRFCAHAVVTRILVPTGSPAVRRYRYLDSHRNATAFCPHAGLKATLPLPYFGASGSPVSSNMDSVLILLALPRNAFAWLRRTVQHAGLIPGSTGLD